MPSQIALIVFLAFISFIIYIDQKRTQLTGSLVWIVAVWILYSGSKGLGVFLNIHTTMEAGSPPDRYFQIIMGLVAIFVLIRRHFPISSAIKQNKYYYLLLFYFLLSVFWARDPAISFRRWGREFIALLIVLLLVSEDNPTKTLIGAFRKAIYAALPLSLLLIKYFPFYGRVYGRWSGEVMWVGIAGQKNGLAMLCSVSILFLAWTLLQDIRNWKQLNYKLPLFIDIFMVGLATYLMVGPDRTFSYSATSTLSLIFGLVFIGLFKIASKRGIDLKQKVIITAIIIIAIGVILPFTGKIPTKTLPTLFNRTETLTGRTEIWQSLVPFAKKNILLGYGYGGFWTTSLRNLIGSHAHNGYLDTILDLGLIGLIFFIIYILNLLKKNASFLDGENQITWFFSALIFIALIRNIAESPLTEFTSYYMWPILAWSFIVNKIYDLNKIEPAFS
ncbi:MAG: O-antigen ligase family protein [Candidatus Aminicenantes bacterium]|nr:O-antigen ligase family protein [Candidatus Aminicenantes bacterium]